MKQHLVNKTIIVTGASRGIGRATVETLSALGANVVALARSAEIVEAMQRERTVDHGPVLSHSADVSQYEDLVKVVSDTVERFGRVDGLINNAGVIDPIARLADSSPEEWSNVVDINLKGVYFGARAVIPKMLENGGGIIVNLSSGAASNALEGWSHYCATKAAVLSLTRCIDKEYQSQGITCVGISPGTVATGMQTSIRSSGINPVSQLNPEVHISSEDVAQAIAWLCTPAGKDYSGTDFSLKTPEGRALAGLKPR